MISYHCDGCGKTLKEGSLRYVVKIDVRAAYDELRIGLADLVRDHRQELLDLIKQMEEKAESTPEEIEETIYKAMQLDLCPACHQSYIKDPLRFSPGGDRPESSVDIDAFLRSLGYGKEE